MTRAFSVSRKLAAEKVYMAFSFSAINSCAQTFPDQRARRVTDGLVTTEDNPRSTVVLLLH
jgi:hypothetical protein